jgi:hypothetical protein
VRWSGRPAQTWLNPAISPSTALTLSENQGSSLSARENHARLGRADKASIACGISDSTHHTKQLRARLIRIENRWTLCRLLEENNHLTLVECRDRLAEETGVRVNPWTVGRALRRLDWT